MEAVYFNLQKLYNNLPTRLKLHILSFLDYLLDDKLKLAKSKLKPLDSPYYNQVRVKGFRFDNIRGDDQIGKIGINYYNLKNYAIRTHGVSSSDIQVLEPIGSSANYRMHINSVRFLDFICKLEHFIISEKNQGRLDPNLNLVSYNYKSCLHSYSATQMFIFIEVLSNGRYYYICNPHNHKMSLEIPFANYKIYIESNMFEMGIVFGLIPYLIVDHIEKIIALDFMSNFSCCVSKCNRDMLITNFP